MAADGMDLAELARRLGGEVRGEGKRPVAGAASLSEAGPEDLAFLRGRRFLKEAAAGGAGALLVSAELAGDPALAGRDLLVVPDPELAMVRALELLHPPPPRPRGVHPTAVIGEGCELGTEVGVGPYAVLGEGCRVGAAAVISAHAVVGRGCRIGAGSVLHPHAVLYDGTELGERVVVHSGAVLGADGFGYVSRPDGHTKVPQVGTVVVEDDVEIGANSTLDRATLGATRVGAGTKVDNLVQVGHNVQLGKGCLLCGQAGIAGSTRLGDGVVLAGQAGVGDHLELGDGVQVAAGSAVFRSAERGGLAGVPAIELGRWRRQSVLLGRLAELFREVKALRRRLDGLGEEE